MRGEYDAVFHSACIDAAARIRTRLDRARPLQVMPERYGAKASASGSLEPLRSAGALSNRAGGGVPSAAAALGGPGWGPGAVN